MKLTAKNFFTKLPIFLFVIVSISQPESFAYIDVPHFVLLLWNICKYISYIIVLGMLLFIFFTEKKRCIGDIVILILLKIFSTLYTEGFVYSDIDNNLRALTGITYLFYMFKYNYKKGTCYTFWFLTLLVALNALTIIMYPNGMYNNGPWENYFLGYDNGHVLVLLPAMLMSILYFEYKRNIFSFITITMCLFSVFKCFSGTTVMGVLIFLILYIATRFPIIRHYLFNKRNIVLLLIGLFISVVVLRLQNNIAPYILKWLNKDVTLTGRVYLWDVAFKSIKQHPIFGIGDSTISNLKLFSLTMFGGKLAYAHNEILDYLVRYGCIGIFLYASVIVKTLKNMKLKKNNFIWYALTSFWIMMMFESYSNYRFYYLYLFLLIIPRINYEIINTNT